MLGCEIELWSQAQEAVAKNPVPVPTGMFVSSLNNASQVAAKRDAARENHVPEPVLVSLFLIVILTVALLGYGCGLETSVTWQRQPRCVCSSAW